MFQSKMNDVKMYLREPLYRNSLYLMANTVTGTGAGFIFWLFAARFYAPEEVGVATAIISAMSLLVMLSILGLNFSIIRYLPGEKKKSRMINTCFTVIGAASVFLASAFIFGVDVLSPALKIIREPVYAFTFVIFTLIISLATFQVSVFIAFRNAKYSFIQNAVAVSRILILPFMIALSVFGIYLSYGLGLIAAFIVGNTFIKKVHLDYRPRLGIEKGVVNDMFHFSFLNYAATIFEVAPILVLPLLVINVLGAELNAYFYVAWTFSSLLLMVPRATSLSLFAEGSYEREELKRNAKKALKFISLLMIPGIALIFLFGDFMLSFFGEGYAANGYEILLLFVIGGIPYSINIIYASIKRVQKEIMPVIYVYGFIAVFTLGGSYFLMQSYGLIGVGVAWILANGVVMGVVGVMVWREWWV